RPPGGERRDGGRGADARPLDLPASPRTGPAYRRASVLRHPVDPELPVRRLRDGGVGQRRAAAADHEHAADRGQRPAREATQPGKRASAEIGVPEAGRRRRGCVRREPLSRAVEVVLARGVTEPTQRGPRFTARVVRGLDGQETLIALPAYGG